MDDVFLDMKAVAKRYGVTRDGLNKMLKRGDFPVGLRIGTARRWNLAKLKEWESQQEAAAAEQPFLKRNRNPKPEPAPTIKAARRPIMYRGTPEDFGF